MRTGRDVVASPTWALLDGRVIGAEVLEALVAIPDASVDSVLCDPPYGIGFMGHAWDQPGDYAALRGNGQPGAFASGRRSEGPHGAGSDAALERQMARQQRRRTQRSPATEAGHQRERDAATSGATETGAMLAGRYDLSPSANRLYQAWCEAWARECWRILKPGGYLLAACATRTYHRLAAGVEDAGFEIRDSILWLYGSGFPKNLDVSKAIDKAAGAERKVVGHYTMPADSDAGNAGQVIRGHGADSMFGVTAGAEGTPITAPATSEAAEWEGWGTALKPAHEEIVMARKPLTGTVVANVLTHGTGAINIAGCQIGFASDADEQESKAKNQHADFGTEPGQNEVYGDYSMIEATNYDAPGRWPTNVMLSHTADCVQVGMVEVNSDGHFPADRGPSGYGSNGHFPESQGGGLRGQEDLDERHMAGELVEVWECAPGCPVHALDAQSGIQKSGVAHEPDGKPMNRSVYGGTGTLGRTVGFGDMGGASRFFYVAKSSRAEREAGLRGKLPCVVCGELDSRSHPKPTEEDPDRREECRRNGHPTVKPIDLDRQLVKMVTPPGGLVVIPFLGSGSEACAGVLEGFEVVGIEREDGSLREDGTQREDYTRLASLRIEWWEQHRGREADEVLKANRRIDRKAAIHEDAGQITMEFG